MKRILIVLLIVFMLLAVLFGCSDNSKDKQSPGGNYGPGGQDNLNDYNNGLSMANPPPSAIPFTFCGA